MRWRNFPSAAQYGLDPDEAAGERWMSYMLLGDFESAWRETDEIEHGPASGKWGRGLLWNGSGFGDKRVLVECRHGLGDTIQFVRYGPLLKRVCRWPRRAASPTWFRFSPAAICSTAWCPQAGPFRTTMWPFSPWNCPMPSAPPPHPYRATCLT